MLSKNKQTNKQKNILITQYICPDISVIAIQWDKVSTNYHAVQSKLKS